LVNVPNIIKRQGKGEKKKKKIKKKTNQEIISHYDHKQGEKK